MIEAKGLTKVYENRPALKPWMDWVVGQNRMAPANVKALDWLNFKVREGEVFGVAGPEGAGKSTLLRILAMQEKPTSGSAKVADCDVATPPKKPWRFVGHMPAEANLFGSDSLDAFLSRYAAALEYPKGIWREKAVNEALERTGLLAKKYDEVGTLSLAERRWLLLAKALLGERKVILLDEPFDNLGPRDGARMRQLLRSLAEKGKTMMIASRSARELAACCDRMAVLEEGKFTLLGDARGILEKLEGGRSTATVVAASVSSLEAGAEGKGRAASSEALKAVPDTPATPAAPAGRTASSESLKAVPEPAAVPKQAPTDTAKMSAAASRAPSADAAFKTAPEFVAAPKPGPSDTGKMSGATGRTTSADALKAIPEPAAPKPATMDPAKMAAAPGGRTSSSDALKAVPEPIAPPKLAATDTAKMTAPGGRTASSDALKAVLDSAPKQAATDTAKMSANLQTTSAESLKSLPEPAPKASATDTAKMRPAPTGRASSSDALKAVPEPSAPKAPPPGKTSSGDSLKAVADSGDGSARGGEK
jgi:ABC-type multidrug transport system ATPase subunit